MGYTLVGLLARGGTAVVELATDEYGRQVARKRLLLTGTWHEVTLARQRLAREAEVLRYLQHPNIVPLLSVEDDGDDLVLVMPYLRGGSLADRMTAGHLLTGAEVARIGRDLLSALATAHRRGIVHRDIKPGNILFDEWGRPALCDFGIAWSRQAVSNLTQAGTVVGTPAFMAPEQARGEPASPAADVFSLAATLTYALTGQTPYGQAPPSELLIRAARGQVNALPAKVSSELRRPLTAMLNPNPARRPSAAEALGGPHGTAELAVPQVRRGWSPRAPARRQAGSARPVRSPIPRRRPAWLAAMLAAVTAGLVVAGAAILPGVLTRKPAAASSPRVTGSSEAPLPADPVDGTPLVDGRPVLANLVPAGDVDTYAMAIQDHLAVFPFCTAEIDVSLTAPPGVADRIRILEKGTVVASATSSDGVPAVAAFPKPDCLPTHTGTYQVQVTSVSGSSTADYRLERTGSW